MGIARPYSLLDPEVIARLKSVTIFAVILIYIYQHQLRLNTKCAEKQISILLSRSSKVIMYRYNVDLSHPLIAVKYTATMCTLV